MACESIKNLEFSEKTDVWSFGIGMNDGMLLDVDY